MKIVAAADIHGSCDRLAAVGAFALDNRADLILLAGDICSISRYNDFIYFVRHLSSHGRCPVILTPGNHDFWKPHKVFESADRPYKELIGVEEYKSNGFKARSRYGYGVLCLFDQQVDYRGIKIYGTPWINYVNGKWNYEIPAQVDRSKYFVFPDDTDILLSHCCPFGYGDSVTNVDRVGSEELVMAVSMHSKLKYHIFGHCHENGGWTGRMNHTTLCNVSCCDGRNNTRYDGIMMFEID